MRLGAAKDGKGIGEMQTPPAFHPLAQRNALLAAGRSNPLGWVISANAPIALARGVIL